MKNEDFIYVPSNGFSWHRLLRRTLVRPVFMASGERSVVSQFETFHAKPQRIRHKTLRIFAAFVQTFAALREIKFKMIHY